MSRRDLQKPSGVVVVARRGDISVWAMGLAVGVVVGPVVGVFRALVAFAQFLFYGVAGGRFTEGLTQLPWYRVLLGGAAGGIIVALLLVVAKLNGGGERPRAYGLDDLKRARRLRSGLRESTLSLRGSFLSAAMSIVSLGAGASAGRECPAIHLGASIAVLPGRLFGLNLGRRRELLAMGAAAAFSVMLGAPISGVLLAREVVLRRDRLSSLGPVAMASIAAWLAAQGFPGPAPPVLASPANLVGAIPLSFYLFVPLVAVAAGVAGLAAQRLWREAPLAAEAAALRFEAPIWTLPLAGGLCLGIVGLAFPQSLGMGFDVASMAIGSGLDPIFMLVLAIAKVGATAMSFAGRFGGGVIAPALFVGVMLGGAVGAGVGALAGDVPLGRSFFGWMAAGVVLAVAIDAPWTACVLVMELSHQPEIAAATLASSFIAIHLARTFIPDFANTPLIVPLHGKPAE